MPDSIATFPLRNATQNQLNDANAQTFGEFNKWFGQAGIIAAFCERAQIAGIAQVLSDEVTDGFNQMLAMGYIVPGPKALGITDEMIDAAVNHQLAIAEHGTKLAAITILHS